MLYPSYRIDLLPQLELTITGKMMIRDDSPDVTAKYRIDEDVYRIVRMQKTDGELVVFVEVGNQRVSYTWSTFKKIATKAGTWL